MRLLKELPAILQDRRKTLKLNQKDMLMKVGMTQQQYQRIESGADTRLSTLLRILEGIDMELMLIPKEDLQKISNFLNEDSEENVLQETEHQSSWNSVLSNLEDDL